VKKVQWDDVSPIVDGSLLERPPLATFTAGQALQVPLMIGTNSREGSLLGEDANPQTVISGISTTDLNAARSAYGSQATDDHELARLLFRDHYFAGPASPIAAHEMHGCWVAFARSGRPECPGAPPWPTCQTPRHRWMVLSAQPRLEEAPDYRGTAGG
jgi:para-nitrobenzyl esterase